MRRLMKAAGAALVLVALAGPAGAATLHPAPAAVAQDIRDIHGPIATPTRPLWPYLLGAGIVVAVAAGVALSRRRRTRPLSPADRALQALDEARALTATGARGFSFAVSEIVRQYVEEAFVVRASHRTTEELLAELMQDRSPVAAHRAELAEFLHYCDLAKFAGWSLSPADMAAMLTSAEAFVRATAAAPPSPAPTAAGPAQPARGHAA